MIANIPNNFFTNDPQVKQQVQQLGDEAALDRDDVGDFFRTLILRYDIESIINRNYTESVQQTSVSIFDMQQGAYLFSFDANTEQFAASVNKLPIALLVLQDLRSNKLNMSQTLTWQESDRRAGAGVFDQPNAPLQGSVQDVLFDMLNRSGNTAVRTIVNGLLGGPQAVNDRLAAIPQLPHTRLQVLDATHFYMGNSTTRDSMWTMRSLMLNQDQFSGFMRHAMATNIYTDFGVRSQLAGNDYILLVNKIGWLIDPDGNNHHDVGLIYNWRTHKTYGYSFMTTVANSNSAGTGQAAQSLKDMGRVTLRYAGDKRQTQPFHAQSQALRPESKVRY